MSTASFTALVRAVVSDSVANDWDTARAEWDVTAVDEDPRSDGICVCGQLGLAILYTITNRRNGAALYPIGSTCVNQFARTELNTQVATLSGLLKLREAIRAGRRIELTSEFFTRAMLEYLYDEGAFTADDYNKGKTERDFEFLLDMFNKRNKDNITAGQKKMIRGLLWYKVRPFILAHDKLGTAEP